MEVIKMDNQKMLYSLKISIKELSNEISLILDNNRIVYQDGDFDRATGELGYENWKSNKIVAVYDKDINSFGECEFAVPIWKAKEE